MILKKYHTLFFSKIKKDVAKIVVSCSRDWCLRVNFYLYIMSNCQRVAIYKHLPLNFDRNKTFWVSGGGGGGGHL